MDAQACGAPDQRAFEADATAPAFRLGEAERRWRLISIEWPMVLVAVAANNQNESEYVLRLDCANYPQEPPTGGPWDLGRDATLESGRWPCKGRASMVFRPDWRTDALYMPCDRVGISGHSNWQAQMPARIWRPSGGIVQYLEFIYALLND